MLTLGSSVYVDFRVVDSSSNPVTGLTLSSFAVIFRRNEQTCNDTLSFKNYGDGTYTVSYTPSAAGHDYLDLYNVANDVRVVYTEDIVAASSSVGGGDVTTVDQNYPTAGFLQVPGPNPQNWTLLMFLSSDWSINKRADSNAVGITSIDSLGDWVNPITVSPGVYHIVIRNGSTVTVMKAYMEIPNG